MDDHLNSLWHDEMGCSVCHELWARTKSITINSKRFKCSVDAVKKSAAQQECPSCELLVRAVNSFESTSNRKVINIQMHFVHPDEPSDWLRYSEQSLLLRFQFDDIAYSDYYEVLCPLGEPFYIHLLIICVPCFIVPVGYS